MIAAAMILIWLVGERLGLVQAVEHHGVSLLRPGWLGSLQGTVPETAVASSVGTSSGGLFARAAVRAASKRLATSLAMDAGVAAKPMTSPFIRERPE